MKIQEIAQSLVGKTIEYVNHTNNIDYLFKIANVETFRGKGLVRLNDKDRYAFTMLTNRDCRDLQKKGCVESDLRMFGNEYEIWRLVG